MSAERLGPAGRFVLGKVLGHGAFGEVRRARDTNTGEDVALKVFGAEASPRRQGFAARFEALSRIRHPNLVRLRQSFLDQAPAFYSMDLAPGDDLVSYVRGDLQSPEPGPHPPRALPLAFGQPVQEVGRSTFVACPGPGLERLRLALAGLARGLTALHDAGFVHRDIQAKNVRVAADRAVLVDLDLAAERGSPHDGFEVGTAFTLAPEQCVGGDATPSSDWYAVGLVVFEALTGAPPFSGSAQEVLLRKRTIGAPPPSLVVRPIPDDLDRLCGRLLSVDPAARPNGAELLSQLGLEG